MFSLQPSVAVHRDPRTGSARLDQTTMRATLLLAGMCVAVHVVRLEVPGIREKVLRIPSEEFYVSGKQVVDDGKWYSLILATLGHASRGHLLNNVAMFLCVAPQVEQLIGEAGLVVLFFSTGLAGWIGTLLFTRFAHADMWKLGVAQFQTSIGSSPATYGVAMFASLCLGPEIATSVAFGMPNWLWLATLIFLPKFFGDHYGLNLAKPSRRRLCIFAAVILGSMALGQSRLMPPILAADVHFFIYLAGCLLARLYVKFVLQAFGGGGDNIAHLFGAFWGIVASFAGGFVQSSSLRRVYCWICIARLVYCAAVDLQDALVQ